MKNHLKELATHCKSIKKGAEVQAYEENVYIGSKKEDKGSKEDKSSVYVKKFPGTEERTKALINLIEEKIKKEEQKLSKKEENKSIALGTSKINYNDPRITVAWCKRNEVPIEKVFTKALRTKFPWAMYCEPDWKF